MKNELTANMRGPTLTFATILRTIHKKHFSLGWRTTETSSYKRGHKQAYGQTSFLVQQGNKSYRLKGGKRKTISEVDLIAKKVVDAARNFHGIQEIKPKDPVHTHRAFLVPSSSPSNPPYTVSDTDKGWTCTCLDYIIRRKKLGEDCKHITQTKALTV